MSDDIEYINRLCEVMHDAYESAAPLTGWRTNPESRKPWDDVPAANKATMRYAVRTLIQHIEPSTSEQEIVRLRAEVERLTGMVTMLADEAEQWRDNCGVVRALADQLAEALLMVANTWGVRAHVREREHAPVMAALAAYEQHKETP